MEEFELLYRRCAHENYFFDPFINGGMFTFQHQNQKRLNVQLMIGFIIKNPTVHL
jgi:hypothetical protein